MPVGETKLDYYKYMGIASVIIGMFSTLIASVTNNIIFPFLYDFNIRDFNKTKRFNADPLIIVISIFIPLIIIDVDNYWYLISTLIGMMVSKKSYVVSKNKILQYNDEDLKLSFDNMENLSKIKILVPRISDLISQVEVAINEQGVDPSNFDKTLNIYCRTIIKNKSDLQYKKLRKEQRVKANKSIKSSISGLEMECNQFFKDNPGDYSQNWREKEEILTIIEDSGELSDKNKVSQLLDDIFN